MKWFKKVFSFILGILISPTELEKNRREHSKKKAMRDIHMENTIICVVISCKTLDHVESCREWIKYMLAQKIINLLMYEGLDKAIDLKEAELQLERKKHKTLPHLAKRAEAISKYEKTRNLRIVKVHEIL